MNIDVVNNLFTSDEILRHLLQEQICTRRTDGNDFQRLVFVWNEQQQTEDRRVNAIQHLFTVGIDSKNRCYIDCRKRLIFLKIVISTLCRPIMACVVTAYSLSMIPIFRAIFAARSGEITSAKAWQWSMRSIKDIVRVPLYELAMIIIGCVGVLIAPLAPITLYHFRELIGKIERAMCYGEYKEAYALAPCFQSLPLKELVIKFATYEEEEECYLTDKSDTDYGEHSLREIWNQLGTEDYLSLFEVVDDQYLRMQPNFEEAFQRLTPEKQIALRTSLAYRGVLHYSRAMITRLRKVNFFGCQELGDRMAYTSPAVSQIDQATIARLRNN